MLKEFLSVRQEKVGFRRFFSDQDLQLFLWYPRRDGPLKGFQLVLLNAGEPAHAFTWEEDRGGVFTGVWADEDDAGYNPTPLLVANGKMPKSRVLSLFRAASLDLDPEIQTLVAQAIETFDESVNSPQSTSS